MKTLLRNSAILVLAVGLLACEKQEQASTSDTVMQKTESAAEHAKKHLDPKYVCPMHPQIIRDKPGNCPICGMNLVAVQPERAAQSRVPAAERRILYYRHPHNPQIISNKPKTDEMGMDYVPIYDDGGGSAVKVSPSVVQNLGIRTAIAKVDQLWRRIDTVGYVDHDETRLSHIHLRTDGWIEKLNVKAEGERVTKGSVLLEVYSPALVNAQEEYLQALRSSSESLTRASAERLMALGVTRHQINRLRQSKKVEQRIRIVAPQDGVVSMLKVREGMYVKPATDLMSLADLSSVWILAEVFESQADWVKTGQSAEVQLPYRPGKTWEGRVEYVYPSLDPKTRTLKVRLRFDNVGEVLKPNMYANVTIFGGAKKQVLVIPREAVIRTGHESRVILDQGDGTFKQRKVVLGIESGNQVEIQAGLREGERVVTSGQFLIDSEASLKASLARMGAAANNNGDDTHEMEARPITGTGIIKKIIPTENRLNLAHDPIDALGWPSMIMDFDIKAGVKLEGLKVGDKVTFGLEQGKDGYIIGTIRKTDQQEDRP